MLQYPTVGGLEFPPGVCEKVEYSKTDNRIFGMQ